VRKTTTWALRATAVVVPLLGAAGSGSADDYCYNAQVLRTVTRIEEPQDMGTYCSYWCTSRDYTEWTCWLPDPIGPFDRLPYSASRAPRARSRSVGSGATACSWQVVTNEDTSTTYEVSKEKPKDGEGIECDPPIAQWCCEGWNGACEIRLEP
jgi:hypothetical protein